MELIPNSTDIPYTLGRLFYIYERIQKEANRNRDGSYRNLNATVKDKFFIAASTTPALIFPSLNDLSKSHLRVAYRVSPEEAAKLELDLIKLSCVVGNSYPARFSLPERGSFQLGYYFEKQNFYQSSKKEETENV